MVLDKTNCILSWILGAIFLQYVVCFTGNTPRSEHLNGEVQALSFFDISTRKFVHWLNKDPPVELMKDVVSNREKPNKHLIKKILSYERPFFAISGVSFFLALITLVSGIAFGCQNTFRKVAATGDKLKTSNFHTKWIHAYMLTLAVISCFLLVVDVSLFQTNNRVSKSLVATRNTLTNSIDELQFFQNNTLEKLHRILRDDFDSAVSDSMIEFRALADCGCDHLPAGDCFKRKALQFKETTKSAMLDLQDMREVLSHVNLTLGELQSLSTGLKSKLGKMDTYYKEAKRLCSGRGHVTNDDELCSMFVDEKDVFAQGKPLEISNNVSVVISNLNEFSKTLNFTPVYELVKSRSKVERRLCKERASKLKELEKFCNGIRFAKNIILNTVKKYSDQLADKTLMPMKSKVDSVLARDSSIITYDRYRWWVSFFLSLGVLLALLTTMISVTVKGTEPFLERVSFSLVKLKTRLALLPRRLFLSCIVLHFPLSVVANVCAGIVFIVVSNMAVACDVSTDYEHLDNILGTSDLLKESDLFTKGHRSFKIFKTINECPKSGTLWTMLDLDKKFNINKSIHEVNKIPRITEQLFGDSTILNRTNKENNFPIENILKKWKDVDLGNINVEFIRQQVKNPIVDPSFHRLSTLLRTSFRDHHGDNVTRSRFKMFQSLSNQAFVIEEDYFKMYSVLSKLLSQRLTEFQRLREKTLARFANISNMYSDLAEESDLWDNNKIVDHHVMKIVKVIEDYLKDGVNKARNEVGNCAPVKQAYSDMVCVLCNNMFSSWNIWWILLLISSCLTTLSVVLCVLILKQINGTENKYSNERGVVKSIHTRDVEALD